MENSTFTVSTFLDHASKVLYGAQTEIMIFLFAFGIHALFFGRLRVRSQPSPRKDPKKVAMANMQSHAANSTRPASRSFHAKELASIAERCCELKDAGAVAAEISQKIQAVPTEDTVEALAGLIEGAGRAATPQLLAAVRSLVRERGLKPNIDLGELLLRNFFNLRLLGDFDEVYGELVASHGVVPSVAVLALKASLRGANLAEVLERMVCLQSWWGKDSPQTPSAGPAALLTQIVRLAAQEKALPQLLKRLQDMGLLADTLDSVLVECVQRADPDDVQAVLQSSSKYGLQFGEAAYCALIKNTSNPQEAISLFVEAVGKIKGQAKDILTVGAEWALVNESGELADEVLKQLPAKPPAEAVGKLLRCYGKDEGLELYRSRFTGVDLSFDIKALHLIFQATLEDESRGQKALEDLLATSTETVRVSLLKSFSSEKQLSSALAVLWTWPGKGCCLYNAAIEACIDCRSIDDAEEVMAAAVKGGIADTISYNTIVKAYLQAKRPRDARKAVESMKASGLMPNIVTFNELMDAVVKTMSLEEAWPVLSEMKAFNLKANRITCAILLKAVQSHTKAADVERVISVINDLEEDLDEVLLCSVVDACIRAGRAELLIPQLQKQHASGRSPVKGAHTYGSIIRAYGFVHNINGVWETWREMRTRHVPANAVALGCMTEALVTNGEPEAAYELINEMVQEEQWASIVNAVIYCSVLKGFSHQKRFDRMWTVYQEMLGLKLQFSIVTFNTLVDACSRNCEMSRIPALLKDMVAQGIPPNIITYSAILKGYCQENRIEEAFEVVEGMVQTTKFRPDEIMFNTLLDGCARQGLFERGLKVLQDMENAKVTPTNFTLSVLVKLANRSKKLDAAFTLCEEHARKYKIRLNVHVYANLINACINNKDIQRAFEVLEKMLSERVRPDTRTYSLLLRGYVSVGEGGIAAGLMRAAVGLKDSHPRLASFDTRLLQAQGGLPSALITEVLEGISGQCHDERLAVALIKDLRGVSHVKLDPKLQFRLATTALNR